MKKKQTKLSEKERLALLEKKMDIQKKRLEIRNEKLFFRKLESGMIGVDEQMALVSKMYELRSILSSSGIDAEKTILGSEPFLKPILNDKETGIIKSKLFELVKQF